MKRKITFIAVVIASSFVGMAQAHLNLTDALGGSSDEAVAFRKWVLATHKIDSSVFDYSNNAQNTFVNSPTTNIGNSNQTAHNLLDNHNYDLQTYWIPQFESAWSELPKPTNTTTTPSGNYNRGGTPTYSIPDNTPKPVYYGPTQRPNTSVEIENAKPETPHLDGQHNVEINPAHGNPEGVDVAPMLAQQKLTADKYAAATVPVQAPHLDGQHNVEINPAHGNPEGVDVAPMLAQQKLTSEKYVSQNISDKRVSSSNETTLNKKQSLASRKVAEIAQYNAMQLKIDNMALADNHHRIASNSAAISSNSQRLDSVQHHQAEQDSRINENKKQASAGISAAFAQANIPQVTDSQQFAVGAGVGGYDSENAIAVGASFHATQNTIVKMTVSDDTQNNFGYGAGVSVGW
ncbi:YadA C-terminal domain-containing protein [Hafnia paralvei]|uniref:YadA C-terminal domain-containing protein n=1 Tax=Hafnia paralvei TaxID=546367 RepID=UPI00241E3EA8|nr:YadA C-terminal domain-containing protein [Hafnia paralvei]